MRVVLAVLLLVGLTHARPQLLKSITDAAKSVITKFDTSSNELGEYTYSFESDDGQSRYETRKVINPGTNQETSVVEGYYSYIDPNGERKTVGYKADENGYNAEGEHLPDSANARRKPPEVGIPPAAVSSLSGGGLGR